MCVCTDKVTSLFIYIGGESEGERVRARLSEREIREK